MNAERQPGGVYQRLFDFEESAETPRPGDIGADGTPPESREEPQTFTASDPARALTVNLMEEVTQRDNLNRAYRRVMANQGAPGVDGMTVAPKSLDRAQDRVREITRRNRGVRFERMVGELNSFLAGWVAYFRYAKAKTALTALGSWVRRKLRILMNSATKSGQSPIRDFKNHSAGRLGRGWPSGVSGRPPGGGPPLRSSSGEMKPSPSRSNCENRCLIRGPASSLEILPSLLRSICRKNCGPKPPLPLPLAIGRSAPSGGGPSNSDRSSSPS
jgi:hypothetical protein